MDVRIHLPAHQITKGPPHPNGFYGKLKSALEGQGYDVSIKERRSIVAGPEYSEDAFHFVHQGLVDAPEVLNTAIAYLSPFWYADAKGVYAGSSIAELEFDPASVPMDAAQQFRNRLHNRLVQARKSRRCQPNAVKVFSKGAVAVFLQGPSMPVLRQQHMSEARMVEVILQGVGDRSVLVKPHPMNVDESTLSYVKSLQADYPNVQIVDANVHDMLSAADLCCSVGSSVSFEAMLHGVPVMLFGDSDFHHWAVTVETKSEFADNMDEALSRDWDFDRFLYWFLQKNCINMGREDWFDRIKTRMGT